MRKVQVFPEGPLRTIRGWMPARFPIDLVTQAVGLRIFLQVWSPTQVAGGLVLGGGDRMAQSFCTAYPVIMCGAFTVVVGGRIGSPRQCQRELRPVFGLYEEEEATLAW